MKKNIVVILLLFLGTLNSISQIKIENISPDYKLRSKGYISENNITKGYYLFFSGDKANKKELNFTILIYDENFTPINSFEFSESKFLFLLESSFQSNEICFRFLDTKEKNLVYKIFDSKGTLKNSYTYDLDKSEYRKLVYYFENNIEFGENINLFNIESKGFFTIINCEVEGQNGFKLIKFKNGEEGGKVFTYNPNCKFSDADFLGIKGNLALFAIEKKNKIFSSSTVNILAINTETWEKEFETDGNELGENIFLPSALVQDVSSTSIKLVGSYYNNEDNINKDISQGIALWEIAPDGSLLKEKYKAWSKDFGNFLSFNDKNKAKDFGFVHIQKAISLKNGKIVVVGEGYKRMADGAGIALSLLTGSNNTGFTMMVVTDLVVFNFDNEFNFEKGDIYKKQPNKTNLGSMESASIHLLAKVLDYYGNFDYLFSQINEENTAYVITYTDYEKGNTNKKSLYLNTLKYENDTLTKDKVSIDSKATFSILLPNVFGKVILIEYYRKDKKLTNRIIKFN